MSKKIKQNVPAKARKVAKQASKSRKNSVNKPKNFKKNFAETKPRNKKPALPEGTEATLSMLLMSVASSAAMAMGLTPNPQTGRVSVDRQLAKFNIDLLMILRNKTFGNLSADEDRFLANILSDLQMKFVSLSKEAQL